MTVWELGLGILSAIIGGFISWILLRGMYIAEYKVARSKLEYSTTRIDELSEQLIKAEQQLNEKTKIIMELKENNAKLHADIAAERRQAAEKYEMLLQAKQELTNTFKGLAQEALNGNNRLFLDLAVATLEKTQQQAQGELDKRQFAIQEMVKPVRDSLEKVDAKIQEMEKIRSGAYEGLLQQVKSLNDSQNLLRQQTSSLVQALRTPNVRGRWGEIQLKRVVEMAGMLEHCDFYQQTQLKTNDGIFRPDMLVKLPGNKYIIVDAKVPLSAYLEAAEAIDETQRQSKLREHAKQVKAHISLLAKKSYWDQFTSAPEFVVLFLPGENFFSAALEQDPALIEYGVEQRVIVATPTTLIALLRAVAYGWRQESLAQNAQEICERARELYKRLSDFGKHMSKLGRSLDSSIESFNKAVGSLESRVLVTARKFNELDATSSNSEIEPLTQIERSTRKMQLPNIELDNSEFD